MKTPFDEAAGLYVLDQLDARERAEFEARLLHDSALAARVRELESALAERIRALPQHQPPAGALACIESRLDGERAAGDRAKVRQFPLPWASVARWGLAAVAVLGIGIIAVQELRRGPAAPAHPVLIMVGLDSGRSTFAELPLNEQPQSADGRFIQLASLAARFWEKPGELPAAVVSGRPGSRGYALFDPGSNEGFIGIQQLPSAGQGQHYHLWMVDTASGRIREAGILPLKDGDGGLYFFSVPPAGAEATSGRLDFFVTAEDGTAPESDRPKGKVVLGDNRI
jgi:hypothetical protein